MKCPPIIHFYGEPMNTKLSFPKKLSSKENAQGMVEFALVLPLLLFIIFGLIEFGRLIATYSMITTSSRDSARYAAAAGNVGNNTPHYLDCDGIRAAARKSAILSPISNDDIIISYDHGPGTAVFSSTCPASEALQLGDRVQVSVTSTFEPIIPLGNLLTSVPLNSTTVRTILMGVEIEGTPDPNGGGGGGPMVMFSIADDTVAEDVGNYTLQVELSVPTNVETYVPFSVSGSASYYTDFSVAADSIVDNGGSISGNFHIPANTTSADVVIAVNNDSEYENNESAVLTLQKPSNATLGSPNQFSLTITDNDPLPNVHFASVEQSGDEESIGGFTAMVILDAVAGKDVIVPYTVGGTASEGIDYSFNNLNPVTIPAGSLQANVSISIIDDSEDEEDETILLTLGVPTNANVTWPNEHTITIIDDDTAPEVAFEVDNQSVGEEMESVNVKVSMTGTSSQDVSVPFSVGGTAAQPDDYDVAPDNLLTIPAGSQSADIVVTLVEDDLIEPNETVIFTLGTPTNATLGNPSIHTLTILGASEEPQVSFETAIGEPQAEGISSMMVRVVLSNLWSEDVSVPFSVDANSTATLYRDYTIASSSVRIPAGEAYADISIAIMDDDLDEDDIETLILNLDTPTNATLGTITSHTAQIQDNEALPVVTIRINPAFDNANPESVTNILVDVSLSHASSKQVTAPFSLSGTATGDDYSVNPASSVVIAAETTTSQITIAVNDDGIYGEQNETVVFTLGTPTNAQLGTTGTSTTYTIEENDLCPSLSTMPVPDDSQLDITVSNPSSIDVMITSISIYWYDNPSNQALEKIYVNNSKIWREVTPHSPVTVSSGWETPDSKRVIEAISSKTLSFMFYLSPLDVSPSDFVSVSFDNGCTVSTSRTH